VICFAIGELRMPNLEAVYDMTWAEFQLRLFAYKRMELNEYQKLRELMWTCYTAPHLDPKKLSKRKEQFMPLPSDKNNVGGVSDAMKEIFLNEYRKYIEITKPN
jgi:hypothetical protein